MTFSISENAPRSEAFSSIEIFSIVISEFAVRRSASASEVQVVDSFSDDGAVQIITDSAAIYIPLADIVDFEAERKRLEGELKEMEAEIKRASGKLANESFTSRAPEAVVNAEREKLAKYEARKAGIEEALAALAGK